jgi:Rrf2 family protein
MQITRQADYALRAMLYLTRLDPGKRAATNQIAEVQKIPPSFLAKIISQLSVHHLINTSRGARGGVSLARPAEEISLLEVVEAIDGQITLNECTLSDDACILDEKCPIHDVWCESQAVLVNKLRTTTFASFVA